MSAPARWERVAESGTEAALRAAWWLHRLLGPGAARGIVAPSALWFFLRRGEARRASLDYLRTLRAWPERDGPAPRTDPGGSLRHLTEFGVQLSDRMALWGGGSRRIAFAHEGSEHLFDLARRGRGAILLGAHLGSFDMMRELATRHGLAVNVLMYTPHAARINRFFERRDGAGRVRVISIEPEALRTGFAIRDRLDRGELVGILGDRLAPAGREPSAGVRFLGRPARLPLAPHLLAAALGCPLLLALCLRTGPCSYRARVRPLWAGGRVPRAERAERAAGWLEAYVRELERACVRAPYQWFNFYPWWSPEEAVPA